MYAIRNVFLALSLLLLSGCGIIDYYFLPPPEDTAQELYESATDAMREKRYNVAAQNFQKVKDNFPFSPYTIESELALGDAYFLDGDYRAAADAYKEFESMHPRHEAMPYVLFQIGTSELKSFISIDRPTTMVQESIEYFTRLKDSYPGSEHVAGVDASIHKARTFLAEHELYLGDVFWNMNKYGPAWRRYSFIVDEYPDVPAVHKHAQTKAQAAYFKYREQQSEETRQEFEGSWKNWFKWL